MERIPQFFYKEFSAGARETFTKPFDVWVIECLEDTRLKLNDSMLPMSLKQDDILVSVGLPLTKLFIETGSVKLIATRIGVKTDRPVFALKRNLALTTTADAVSNGLSTYGAAKDSSLQSILAQLDVALSTRASEATLASLDGKITKCDTDNTKITNIVQVDTLATEDSVSGEIDTSTATSPVTVLTPSSGKKIDTRGVYLFTDSASGEITAEFPSSGILVAKIYCSKFYSATLPEVRFTGDTDEPLQIKWSGLDTGAKIFYIIRYKEVT